MPLLRNIKKVKYRINNMIKENGKQYRLLPLPIGI